MTSTVFLLVLFGTFLVNSAFPAALQQAFQRSQHVSIPECDPKRSQKCFHKVREVMSNCTEYFFSQPLDHFNFQSTTQNDNSFMQRYYVCGGDNWKPNNTIWFYTGNEGITNAVLF